MKKRIFTLLSLLAVMLVVGFTSCQKDELVVEQNTTIALLENGEEGDGNPVFLPGHQAGNAENECASIGIFEFAYKFDPVYSETVIHEGNEIEIIVDGLYFDWTATIGIGAVIVKGGPDANAWFYDPAALSDAGLLAPINPSNSTPYGLSHITFCWNPGDVPPPCEWYGETAWGAGPRYVNKGNWAMYTPFQTDEPVDLIAGQHFVAGEIEFADAEEDGYVVITITLNEGFRLAEFEGEVIEEAVKIQGYAVAPRGNPAPGLFNTYKGNALEITVPAYNFYGIHLDVEREVCPETE